MAVTLYVVVYSSSATQPSAAQIKAAQNGDGGAATWAAGSGSGVAWTGTGQQVTASGLTAGTSYKASAVTSDGTSDSNVVHSSAFTTLYEALTLNVGNYTLTGQSADLTVAKQLDLNAGSYALTGQSATLSVGKLLEADAGSYTLTGYSAELTWARQLDLNAGSYTLSGQSADLTYTPVGAKDPINANAGSYTLTGYSADLTWARKLDLDAGSYTLTGNDANLIYSGAPPAATARRSGPRGIGYRKRYSVKIDDEEFVVDTPAEVEELLAKAREEAEKQAQIALQRAAKAQKRPVRKVLADARKALQVPEVRVDGEQDYAQRFMADIAALYQSTLDTIEIGALMRDTERRIEDDDEDILLLL